MAPLDVPTVRRIAVIGGGISGLAAAHRLVELDPHADVTLFEAGERLGGVLQTIRRDSLLIERSADNFITNVPGAVELCRRVGLEDELQPTTSDRRAFVLRKGRLHEVPSGFTLMAPAKIWPMMATPILSWRGKLRMAWEYFVSPKKFESGEADESLASFVRRRLGSEVFDRLVQPLIGGIYTADPDQLSLRATMPRFLEMEQKYGGLIRGMRRAGAAPGEASPSESSGARYGMFVSLKQGMSTLVDALAARIGPARIRLHSPIERLERTDAAAWKLFIANQPEPQTFDAIIMAAPAPRAAALLSPVAADLADELHAIPHASSAVVCVAYRREQFSRPLEGFGFVVPRIEGRSILSVSYSSQKYSGRAPDGTVLLRLFFGGAMQPEMIDKSDQELVSLAQRELAEILGLSGDPLSHEIVRWRNTMPQFHLGHLSRVRRIFELAGGIPNFALCGNAFYGVGVPHCIRSGEKAADSIRQPT